MNKAIILVMLLLLSTFAVVADNHRDVVTSSVTNASVNTASAGIDDDDNETDSEDEVEIEIRVDDDDLDIDIEDNEIEIEDGEVRQKIREKLEDGELRQRIRQKVEAGFSAAARLRTREHFGNLSEEDKDELKEKLAEMKQEFLEKKQGIQNKVRENREEARASVQALKLAGNFTGTDIAEIMHEYNEDLKEAIHSEEVISNRSKIARFFAGGDHKTAERLEVQTERNDERIERVRIRLEEVEDEELKAELEEHLAALERNQERLNALAEGEKKSKGLFGWIWK